VAESCQLLFVDQEGDDVVLDLLVLWPRDEPAVTPVGTPISLGLLGDGSDPGFGITVSRLRRWAERSLIFDLDVVEDERGHHVLLDGGGERIELRAAVE
jgi:hypothetical protein